MLWGCAVRSGLLSTQKPPAGAVWAPSSGVAHLKSVVCGLSSGGFCFSLWDFLITANNGKYPPVVSPVLFHLIK